METQREVYREQGTGNREQGTGNREQEKPRAKRYNQDKGNVSAIKWDAESLKTL